MKKANTLLIFVILIVVISLFVSINITHKHKDNTSKNSNVRYEYIDSIMIEGMKEEIKVSKYNTHLGFSITYDVERFDPVLLSNGIVEFRYINNKDIKLIVEKMTESTYYENYNKNITEEIVDNLKINYQYMKKDNDYFRLIIQVPNNQEYLDCYTRIDYLINSFIVN